MWLVAPAPELVRGRRVVAHNNLLGDAVNMGAIYADEDVVVDGDLVTGRTGGHCHLFARKIIELLAEQGAVETVMRAMHHIGLNCADPIAIERWYTKHFGFERRRVYLPGPGPGRRDRQRRRRLELFPAKGDAPPPRGESDGPTYPGVRHLAFLVDDLDAKLAEMGDDAQDHARPARHGRLHRGHARRLDLRPGRKHR